MSKSQNEGGTQKGHAASNQANHEVKTCWAISNGTKGTQNQAMGLAEALSEIMPLEILVKNIVIKSPWKLLPGALWPNAFQQLSTKGHLLRAPFPDICIATGRETVPLSIAIKKHSPQTFTIQTQNPRAPSHLFDLVVPPAHDNVRGDNVFSIIGAPSRVRTNSIKRLGERVAPRFAELPSPRIVVLIGGSTRHGKMTIAVCEAIVDCLKQLREQGFGLIISNSRRTDPRHWEFIRTKLGADDTRYIDVSETAIQGGAFPGVLSLAKFILVTEDSVNMIGEAATTGKPVYTIPLEGDGGKFSHFIDSLIEARAVRRLPLTAKPFTPEIWEYEPLSETQRAAEEVLRRLDILSH